jgi:hypothetical protein
MLRAAASCGCPERATLPRRTGASAMGMTAKGADTPCKRRRSRFDSDLLHGAGLACLMAFGHLRRLAPRRVFPGAEPPDPTIGGLGGSHSDPFGTRLAAGSVVGRFTGCGVRVSMSDLGSDRRGSSPCFPTLTAGLVGRW